MRPPGQHFKGRCSRYSKCSGEGKQYLVVAQLAELLLPIPEDPGSIPVGEGFYFLSTVKKSPKNKKKLGMAHTGIDHVGVYR